MADGAQVGAAPNAAPSVKGEAAKPAVGAPAAGAPAQTPAAPAASEPKHKIKVNGKEHELPLSELIKLAQKGAFADQKLKSVDVVSAKTQQLLSKLKTPEGLIEVLKDPALGASPKEAFKRLMASDIIDDELKEEISKWTYENVVKKAKMSPEDIEREEKLRDYERLKKQETDRKQREQTEAQKAEIQKVYSAVRSEVSKQIKEDKTFPQTEGSIRAVIDKLRVMNRQGAPINTENITKALSLVKKDHVMHQQAMFDTLEDPEQLISLLGEARALKISKALVARLKSKASQKAPEKKAEGSDETLNDRTARKFGRERHGYQVMDVL
jgi:hypothetical protein